LAFHIPPVFKIISTPIATLQFATAILIEKLLLYNILLNFFPALTALQVLPRPRCRHAVSRVATNVLAAWRQAGVSVRLGRELNFQNPARCHTRQHPRLRQTARYVLAFLIVVDYRFQFRVSLFRFFLKLYDFQ